jgi:hypothetical protein
MRDEPNVWLRRRNTRSSDTTKSVIALGQQVSSFFLLSYFEERSKTKPSEYTFAGSTCCVVWLQKDLSQHFKLFTAFKDVNMLILNFLGRWPWKSESAKECVTTHLPNAIALKMDGA